MTLVRHLCSSGMIVLDNFLSEKDITNRAKGVNKAGDGIITYHLLTTAKVLQRLFNMLKSYMNILVFFLVFAFAFVFKCRYTIYFNNCGINRLSAEKKKGFVSDSRSLGSKSLGCRFMIHLCVIVFALVPLVHVRVVFQ